VVYTDYLASVFQAAGNNVTPRKNKIITIDGPSGAGKSTIARLLASTAGYTYIDSGAIYRGVAYAYKMRKNEETIEELLQMLSLSFEFGGDTRVTLAGRDISAKSGSPTSRCSHPPCRKKRS
jgi:cytidylate kinase